MGLAVASVLVRRPVCRNGTYLNHVDALAHIHKDDVLYRGVLPGGAWPLPCFLAQRRRDNAETNLNHYGFEKLSGYKTIHLSDVTYGEQADAISVAGERYEYEMGALLEARHAFASVGEVPIETAYERGNASSHFSPVTDNLRILRIALLGHA